MTELAGGETSSQFTSALYRIQILSRQLQRLPDSCLLSGDITMDYSAPIHGGCASVYRGNLQGVAVAVKSLHVHPDESAEVWKVCVILRVRGMVLLSTATRIDLLLGSPRLEVSPASQCCIVSWRISCEIVVTRERLDALRNHRSISQSES